MQVDMLPNIKEHLTLARPKPAHIPKPHDPTGCRTQGIAHTLKEYAHEAQSTQLPRSVPAAAVPRAPGAANAYLAQSLRQVHTTKQDKRNMEQT